MRKPQTLPEKIQRRLRKREEGDILVAYDFLDLSTRAAVDQALQRLARQGVLRRIGRGVYDRPSMNTRLGVALSPLPEEVANAISNSDAIRIQIINRELR